MPALHIQNIPEDLFLQIQRLAKTQDRTLEAQVITLLAQTVQLEKVKAREVQRKTLASIRQRRFVPPKDSPSSLALLLEDRNR